MEYFITPTAQPMTVVLNISWLENIFLETAILTNLNRRPRIEAEARGLLMPACVNDKSGLGRRYLSIWNKKGVNIFSIYQLSHGQFCGLLLFCSMQGVIGNSRHAVSRKKLGWKLFSFQYMIKNRTLNEHPNLEMVEYRLKHMVFWLMFVVYT